MARRLGGWAPVSSPVRSQPQQTVAPAIKAPLPPSNFSPHSQATPSGIKATTSPTPQPSLPGPVAPSDFRMPTSTMEQRLNTPPAQQATARPMPMQPQAPMPMPQAPMPMPDIPQAAFPAAPGRPNSGRGIGLAQQQAPVGGAGGMGGSGYSPGIGPAGGRPNTSAGGARSRLEGMLPPGLQGRVAPGQLERLLAEMMGGRGPGPGYNLRQQGAHGYAWSGAQGAQARGGTAMGSRGGSRGQGGARMNSKSRRRTRKGDDDY